MGNLCHTYERILFFEYYIYQLGLCVTLALSWVLYVLTLAIYNFVMILLFLSLNMSFLSHIKHTTGTYSSASIW